MSDPKNIILQMLSEGKISVEESERLLNAVNKENSERENQSSSDKKNNNKNIFNNIPFFEETKLALNLRDIANTFEQTINHTIKNIEPASKDLIDKINEFGNWMEDVVETVASELTNKNNLPADCMSVDFIVPAPAGTENCKHFIIENIYGEIQLSEGPEFKLLVNGKISKNTLNEMQSSEWFVNNAIKIVDDKMYIGFDNNTALKAAININITLPSNVKVTCKTINTSIKSDGNLVLESINTVSGNVNISNVKELETVIETVNGAIQIEKANNIKAQINTTSGCTFIKNSSLNNLKINSVNGDISIEESEVFLETNIKTVTTTGDISLQKISGPWKSLDITTRRGEVIVDWKDSSSPITDKKINLKSGGEGAVFYSESVSGNIKFR